MFVATENPGPLPSRSQICQIRAESGPAEYVTTILYVFVIARPDEAACVAVDAIVLSLRKRGELGCRHSFKHRPVRHLDG